MALWPSLYNILFSCFFPNSSINLYNQIISLLASIVETYYAFVNESATNFYSFKIQLSVIPPTVKKYPMVLLLLSLSPTISESTYPYRTMFEPPKHSARAIIPLKYLRIHFTSIQCSLPGLFIFLLNSHYMCDIWSCAHHCIH